MEHGSRQRTEEHVAFGGAFRRKRTASHKASCGQDAGLTGADLVEQNCATRLGGFEHSRPTFDAHDISLAGLALVVGDIAFALRPAPFFAVEFRSQERAKLNGDSWKRRRSPLTSSKD